MLTADTLYDYLKENGPTLESKLISALFDAPVYPGSEATDAEKRAYFRAEDQFTVNAYGGSKTTYYGEGAPKKLRPTVDTFYSTQVVRAFSQLEQAGKATCKNVGMNVYLYSAK